MSDPYRPAPSPALLEMLLRDADDEPFGGWAGECAVVAPTTAAPHVQRPLVPPPDWFGDDGGLEEDA